MDIRHVYIVCINYVLVCNSRAPRGLLNYQNGKKNSNSVRKIQATITHIQVPTFNAVKNVIKEFKVTGFVRSKQTAISQHPVSSKENIDSVKENVAKEPRI